MSTHLSHALDAAGISLIFPVFGVTRCAGDRLGCGCGKHNCRDAAKHPIPYLAPRGLNSATRDRNVIERLWKREPSANIGLCTGEVVVLDVDVRHGGDESLALLEQEHGELPATWRVRTGGGGEHVYFSAPTEGIVRNSAGVIGAGLDIRGQGGYVLAPGSVHISGRPYVWSVDHHPDDIALAPMPDWLRARAASAKHAKPPEAWCALVRDGVSEGKRNSSVASLYGHLIRRNVDARVALELVSAWNVARCTPPLHPDEVSTIADSIARREIIRREASHGSRR